MKENSEERMKAKDKERPKGVYISTLFRFYFGLGFVHNAHEDCE